MSGFLAHLAGIALGRAVEGAARPSLPPRYAAPGAGGPDPESGQAPVEPYPASEPAPAERDNRAPRHPGREFASGASPRRELDSPPAVDARSVPAAPSPKQRVSTAAELRPAAISRPPLERPGVAEIEHAGAAAAEAEVRVEPPAEWPAPVPPPAPASASAAAGATSPIRAASVQARRRAALPSVPGPTQLAPLSARAVAGRTEPAREPAPVIHVTIDRIDVRAPAPTPSVPTARRAPAEPSLSLSDFLAAGPPRPRQ